MCKRVKLNSYEPFVRDKTMKFVTHSWYNKTLSFGTPFEFLKRYKIFQCEPIDTHIRKRHVQIDNLFCKVRILRKTPIALS